MNRKLAVAVVALLILPRALAAQAGGVAGAHSVAAESAVDAERLLAHLRYLAADERGGRRTGSSGNAAAREYLLAEFRRLGLEAPGGTHTQAFEFVGRRDSVTYSGVNLLGLVRGTANPDRYIVVTAHYDHVGVGQADATGDSIYNGADDNASGTAALLALAAYFRSHPPANSILFAALDAEEMGLQGARALVGSPPVPLEAIVVNVNMDMVGRNARGELYVAGTYHYPFLKPYVERVTARSGVKVLLGHDRPDLPPGDDWTGASDHGAFHRAGIPFLYFGVEDHPDYHKPSDEIEGIEPGFYARAVATVLDAVRELDADLAAVVAARRAAGAR